MRLDKIAARNIEVFGDVTYRDKKCDVEDAELVTFFNQLDKRYPAFRAVAIHIPNEGKRTKAQTDALKLKGAVVTGASDVLIPGFPALIIELKRRDHTLSVIADDQLDYLEAAQAIDAWAVVALGWEAAMCAFEKWHKENYLQ